MKKYICFVSLMMLILTLNADLNYKRSLTDRSARKEWNNENYDEAERLFRENAINNPNTGHFHYNLGTALYKSEKFDDAQKEFQIALNDKNFPHRDKVFHNLGNIAFKTGEYEQALESYQKALRENPENIDARKNYEMTRIMLQQQQQEQSSNSDNQDNQDDNDQQQEQNQQENQNDEENQQKQQQQQEQRQELNPEQKEAERILQALEQKQEQERNKKDGQSPGVKSGRYW